MQFQASPFTNLDQATYKKHLNYLKYTQDPPHGGKHSLTKAVLLHRLAENLDREILRADQSLNQNSPYSSTPLVLYSTRALLGDSSPDFVLVRNLPKPSTRDSKIQHIANAVLAECWLR